MATFQTRPEALENRPAAIGARPGWPANPIAAINGGKPKRKGD
jgi:hypothetical protein